ncbi:MAG: DUF4340 domain-containing protein [Firmicutes bacterium]|nr:DUF4340 domain-containing protein [Bacillota bacterium]
MSRTTKLALLLAGVLVLGAAAWLAVSSANKTAAQEQAAAEALAAEEAAKQPLLAFSIDTDTVTAMEWTCLAKAGAAYKKDDGSWYVKDDEGTEYVCDDEKVNVLLDILRQLKADRVIEEPGDLKQFGFEEPCTVVTVHADKDYTLTLGDPMQSNKELYYCTSSESTALYTVSDTVPAAFYVTRGELLPAEQ